MEKGVQAPAPAPSPAEVFAQVQSRVLAFDGGGFADLFAPDAVVELPFGGAQLPRRLAGREQIRNHIAPRMAAAKAAGRRFTGYHLLVLLRTQDPEVIVVEFELEGQTGAGDTYRLPYIQVFRVRDGSILSMRDYVDSQRIAAVMAGGAVRV
jgi:ketosteroid isomerase-like protein